MRPDDFVKLLERLGIALLCFEVVAGGIGVAGVDAHAHARLVLHLVDDGGDVVETVPHVGTLPSGVLDDRSDTLRLVKPTKWP